MSDKFVKKTIDEAKQLLKNLEKTALSTDHAWDDMAIACAKEKLIRKIDSIGKTKVTRF